MISRFSHFKAAKNMNLKVSSRVNISMRDL